jgi:type IV pilus assembly protein PilO
MLRNSRSLPPFTLPTAAALAEPKALLRLGLGLLAIANLVAAAFAFHIFSASPEALNAQLAAALAARQAAQVRLNRSRTLTSSIERGKSEGEKFLSSYMMDRRHTYSTILNELYEMAKSAGMDKAGETFPPLDPIPGSEDLDMMSISLTLEGNYAQLVKFVNLLDRSPRFLIIESLTVTPRAKSDILSVTVKLDTFVKEDTPTPTAAPTAGASQTNHGASS